MSVSMHFRSVCSLSHSKYYTCSRTTQIFLIILTAKIFLTWLSRRSKFYCDVFQVFKNTRAKIEPCHEKTNILHIQKQTQFSFAVTAKPDQRICYTDSPLNAKFPASSHLCLYISVSVGPVRKPHCFLAASTRSDTNQAVQPQKQARSLKFHI